MESRRIELDAQVCFRDLARARDAGSVGSGEVAQVTTQAAQTGTFGAHFSNGSAAKNGAGQAWKALSSSSTNQVVGYVNGFQELSFIDSGNLATFTGPGSIINFFLDDTVVPGDTTSGAVDRIRIVQEDHLQNEDYVIAIFPEQVDTMISWLQEARAELTRRQGAADVPTR